MAGRNERGFWEGELSSSALSTATAVTALAVVQRESQSSNLQSQIDSGLAWLAQNQNEDGGWGDTTKSLSNISTTTLCWAAFGAAGADEDFSEAVAKARVWFAHHSVPPASRQVGALELASSTPHSGPELGGTPGARFADQLARAIIARYGKDRTFSVPILTMCALAGRLGSGPEAWRHVIPLPFELAACPHQLFAALRLPVVSYALPALIAIGQARHFHAPSRNLIARMIRNATRKKTLRVLAEIQPGNGGFLEATPLTSFVTMSLAGSGQLNHTVTKRALEFLCKSQRTDGSWPIDTNLATWCTTLAIDALPESAIRNPQSAIHWLLNQQNKTEHPYTHAAPGGWAWTDLPGGVPDADDTAGALLALSWLHSVEFGAEEEKIMRAAEAGLRWLLDLQNRDGGIPTFCRGWGALPFDRSSPDITAHAIRAWLEWRHVFDARLDQRMRSARRRALKYLRRTQNQDGSWRPLWFGSQHALDDENLTYGTARVLKALATYDLADDMVKRGATFLLSIQNPDGSWSGASNGPPSIEETALATEALLYVARSEKQTVHGGKDAAMRGVTWLVNRVESSAWHEPSPIGFYFAKLWYFERLYPLIFTVGALRAANEALTK
jgi:squalene-hopene/tetraprenyl-beta-curcumene cyclase